MSKITATDAVIRGCLLKLRAGDMGALGVLADYLEEIGHPLARRVRIQQRKWVRNVSGCWKRKPIRTGAWARWSAVASWHYDCQQMVLKIFGWKTDGWDGFANSWRYLASSRLEKIYRRLFDCNEPLATALFGEPGRRP